ncbi:hypothetical protein M8J76_004317 [Diaphorina citri]|nr:hypothetical protein M8J76_004317 [Diaphorina citri]
MKGLILYPCLVLFCISQVSGKPFYWGDRAYYTTKQPLLKKAFSKFNHWFKNLIDAYPSSTWYYKEHIYGQTYWKDPEIVRAWLKRTDMTPLINAYRERATPQKMADPFIPGATLKKQRIDFLEDNVLSIPDSEELIRMQEKNYKNQPTTKKKQVGHAREIVRGYD